MLSYTSFEHAQGSQPLQLHYLQCYTRMLRSDCPLDPTVQHQSDGARLRRRSLPTGHMRVDEPRKAAQFSFWWALMWDVLTAVYTDNPAALPTATDLDQRIGMAGGTRAMSSFSDDEMTALAATIADYRDNPASATWSARDVAVNHFLPTLLRVELGFQGYSPTYPQRPRTDAGDPHASRLLEHCRRAQNSWRPGNFTADVYIMASRALDDLGAADQASDPHDATHTYRLLIEAYNANHPSGHRDLLHIPWPSYSPEARSHVQHRWWA